MTRLSRRIPIVLVAGFLFSGGLFAGCSDDEPGDGGVGPGSTPIQITEILFNPKALGPGDTLLVTAVVTSDSQNIGDFVTYEWTKTGGEWVDPVNASQSTIRWRAPADRPGIYGFTVTARNSVNSASLSDQVFVGVLNGFIADRGGEIFAIPGDEPVYYTSPAGTATEGLILRRTDGVTDEVVFSELHQGFQYSFDKSRTREAHMFVERQLYVKRQVLYDDLVAKTQTAIGKDDREFAVRWSEFSSPYVSTDGALICYQGGLLDQTATPAQGGVDTFAVFVYDVSAQTTQRATFQGFKAGVSNSFYPTISSDQKHVVFISDRRGQGVWEYYALPIQGGTVVVDTIPDALVELSDTGGRVTDGLLLPSVVARSQWCPNSANPTLATVGVDKRLRLVPTNGTGARLVDIDGEVADVRWAPSGAFLVASIAGSDGQTRIYRITPGGDYQTVWEALPGDRIDNLAVSPDEALLVYSNRRGQNVWYELIDADRSSGDAPPVRITGAWVPGAAANYGRPLQSLRPAWASAGTVVYLFFTEGSTPRVMSLDLAGVGG